MTKGLKFNFSMNLQSVIAIFYGHDAAMGRAPKSSAISQNTCRKKLPSLQQSPHHRLSRPLLHLYGKVGFIDMLQIMGIRIADNPALLQIRIVPLQLMQFLQIPDLRCLKTAVRRYEAQICNQAVGRLIPWAGNMTPS